jgi:hypothetical protein
MPKKRRVGMANDEGKQTKGTDAQQDQIPSPAGATKNTDQGDEQTTRQIARLEQEMTRAERGMLCWTKIVGVFTAVIAIIGGFQWYAFVESERAFLVVTGIHYVGGEPTSGPGGYNMLIIIKNVGKHVATDAHMIVTPGFFIVNKELAEEPTYDSAHSIVKVIPPITPFSDLILTATANVPDAPDPMTAEQRLSGVLHGDIPVRIWGLVEYNKGYPSWHSGQTGFCFEYIPADKRFSQQQRFQVCQKQKYTYTR